MFNEYSICLYKHIRKKHLEVQLRVNHLENNNYIKYFIIINHIFFELKEI